MSTRELIRTEIENVPDEKLDELYSVVKGLVAPKTVSARPGIMAKLRSVTIEAPADFAANLDLYLSGDFTP